MVKNVYLLCSGSPPSECPYCDSFTSLEDCDNNAETQKCEPSETMCIVFKQEDVEADSRSGNSPEAVWTRVWQNI